MLLNSFFTQNKCQIVIFTCNCCFFLANIDLCIVLLRNLDKTSEAIIIDCTFLHEVEWLSFIVVEPISCVLIKQLLKISAKLSFLLVTVVSSGQ